MTAQRLKNAHSLSPSCCGEQYLLDIRMRMFFQFSDVVDSTPLRGHDEGRSQVRFLAEPGFRFDITHHFSRGL